MRCSEVGEIAFLKIANLTYSDLAHAQCVDFGYALVRSLKILYFKNTSVANFGALV